MRIFLLALTCSLGMLFSACDGVDSRDTETQTVRTTNAFRSLRLGQTESPNSPVATTAASNNGEALVILNRTPGSTDIEHLLYLTPADRVARITFSDGKLPSNAEAEGVQVNFSGYTKSSVDIQVGGAAAVTVPLDPVITKLLSQLGDSSRLSRAEPDGVIRALYTRSIIAMRLFGCGTLSVLSQAEEISPAFLSITQSACSSQLVELLRALLAEGNFAERTLTGLKDDSSCDFTSPDWVSNFANCEQCARTIGEQLIALILGLFPTIGDALVPTPTPTPIPPPPATNNDNDDDDDENSSRCRRGRFRCASGDRACNEDACDGVNDCDDGSDESSTLCTPEVLCCIAAEGCPGEGGGTCTPSCCCCPAGSQCSSRPYLSGCEPAPFRLAPR